MNTVKHIEIDEQPNEFSFILVDTNNDRLQFRFENEEERDREYKRLTDLLLNPIK